MNKVDASSASGLLGGDSPYDESLHRQDSWGQITRYPYRREPYGRARLAMKDGSEQVRDVKVQFTTADGAYVIVGFVDDDGETRSFWVEGSCVDPISRDESSYRDPYDEY